MHTTCPVIHELVFFESLLGGVIINRANVPKAEVSCGVNRPGLMQRQLLKSYKKREY